MKIQHSSSVILGIIGTVLSVSTSAQAANFTTNVTQTGGPTGNTQLDSVRQNGITINDFSLVQGVNIISNTPINPGRGSTSTPGPNNNSTGGASTDRGDNATSPIAVSGLNNPTGAEVAAFLGNRNLNNIIDTEDTGAFTMNLFFDSLIQQDSSGLDSLFFWERGKNSDLRIQAIDSVGNLIGNVLTLLRGNQQDAGFSIDTTEVDGAQHVGSWGVNLSQLGVTSLSGIQVVAESGFNGPDFKVVARQSVSTPEPENLVGLGVIFGTIGFISCRNRRKLKISH